MVFGILRMTNFAHGDMMMVGAFAPLVLGVARRALLAGGRWVASLLAALAGVIVERIAYRPVRGAADVTLLLTSLARDLHPGKPRHPHLHVLATQFPDPGPG